MDYAEDSGTIESYLSFHEVRLKFLRDLVKKYHRPYDRIAVFGAGPEYAQIVKACPTAGVVAYNKDPHLTFTGFVYCDLERPLSEVIRGHYDIGVCSEVVEHLARPLPDLVSDMLMHCDTVIIQTPNSKALYKRLRVLFGWQSPWECVKEATTWGHIYEYDGSDVRSAGPLVEFHAKNYFGDQRNQKIYNRVCGLLPGDFRDGFTVVYRLPK